MNFFKQLKEKFFQEDKEHFIQIIPRVYTMNYPSSDRIVNLQNNFKQVKSEYKIWNVSEYTYEPIIFDCNVLDYHKPGYPCQTLHDFFIMIEEMSNWIDSNPYNLIFIHCQSSFNRTAIVLICLLYFLKTRQSIKEVQDFVLEKLNCELLNNQKLYIKYIESAFSYVNFNKHPIYLKKISLSQIPFIKILKKHAEDEQLNKTSRFKPYVQIFVRGIVNKSDLNENQLEFELEQPLLLQEDFLIRIRHFMSSEIRYSVGRLMLTPLMIFEQQTKIPQQFIDFGECVEIDTDDFFIKLDLDFDKKRVSQTFLNLEAVLKKKKIFDQQIAQYTTSESTQVPNDIFIIADEDIKQKDDNKEQINQQEQKTQLKEEEKKKIEQLMNQFESIDENNSQKNESETSEDDDYFKKLEQDDD